MVKCTSFFLFFPLWKIVKNINNIYICGESKSSYKEREEKGRTHKLLFLYFLKNKIHIFNIYIYF